MIDGIFHFNLNVTDLDRSIAFYEALGFTVVDQMQVEHPDLGAPLGLRATQLRTAFLRLGDEANAPMLDLVQFIDPKPEGQPYANMTNIGIGRIAFTVANIPQLLRALEALGSPLLGPTTAFMGPGGVWMRTVCFLDPDSICLQAFAKEEQA